MASLRQSYEIAGATLMLTWEADRPITSAELDLIARLAQTVERSTVMREDG